MLPAGPNTQSGPIPKRKLRKRGRKSRSCSECSRLKRKCDRQWPCGHCVSRKTTDLCVFRDTHSATTGYSSSDSQMGDVFRHQGQASNPSAPADPAFGTELTLGRFTQPSVAGALRALGYVEGDMVRSIGRRLSSVEIPSQNPEVRAAIRSVPSRPHTDLLVQNYFRNVNHHYEALYQPGFLQMYDAWWRDRRTQRQAYSIAEIAFIALLLQVCANSTQFLPPSTSARLVTDMGASIEQLGNTYSEGSESLGKLIPSGEAGLPLVQQQFLTATWWKTQAEITKSWHSLASSIRQAQEIGLHNDTASHGISALEREMRRRMWYILCIWDISMHAIFSRPLLVTHGDNMVPLPDPHFDQSTDNPTRPSAATVIGLEVRLWAQFSRRVPAVTSCSALAFARVRFVKQWMASLPDAFQFGRSGGFKQPEHPSDTFRRYKLQASGYMSILYLLRPLISSHHESGDLWNRTGTLETEREQEETADMVSSAIDAGLQLMRICKGLFDFSYPTNSKYFMVAFCPFDTAATLCCALMTDASRAKIPRRLEVSRAIGCALYIATKLGPLSNMGKATRAVLDELMSRLDLAPEERLAVEEARVSGELLPDAIHPGVEDISSYNDIYQHEYETHMTELESNIQLENQVEMSRPDETIWWHGLDKDFLSDLPDVSCLEDIYNYSDVFQNY